MFDFKPNPDFYEQLLKYEDILKKFAADFFRVKCNDISRNWQDDHHPHPNNAELDTPYLVI